MSKKTKRSNKGRKDSSVVSPSRKRGRDEVTGLYMDIGGEKVISDTVYGLSSDNGQGPIKEFAQYEFEFGKNAITLTFTGGSDNWKRYTLLGEFDYDKKGEILSAKTREFADWTHSPTSEWRLVFQRQQTTTSPYEIFTGFEGAAEFDYDKTLEENPVLATGVNPEDFFKYQSSNYYKHGWWDNPFATNLI